MPNRYALAILMTLAAVPAAAQKPEPADRPAAKEAAAAAKALADAQKVYVYDALAVETAVQNVKALKDFTFDIKPVIDAADAVKIAKYDYESKSLSAIEPVIADARIMSERLAYGYEGSQTRDREAELREREREREAQYYNEGQNAAMESRYDRALQFFNRVIDMRGSKLDAALYWKAYAQNRLGQRTEALSTLAELSKNHPNSSYRKQGTVLEAEVRRDVGQAVRPQDSTDDEVKLMALQALQNTAPDEAIPMLEKVLEGTASPRVKRRALFVLSQSKTPRARDVLRNYAKGSSTRELQSQAIEYLGVHGGPESRAMLGDIYAGSTDVEIKRRILRAFMVAGEKDRLFKAAQGEQNAELRAEAVSQLGNMQAHEELWQLYQRETAVDVKRRIIRSIQNAGNVDRLIEVAKSEQNPELRREAVRGLGVMRSARTGDVLVQIYGSSTDVDVKKAVISALFIQENATALVALARKEQDVNMQKELVSKLANMRNKIATDYMIELLGK
jgi:HEAT repeat protein